MTDHEKIIQLYKEYEQRKHTWEYKLVPARGKVLVCAPHPDDEIIGCGGTISKHALLGDDIWIFYFTTGELVGAEYKERVKIRKQESQQAVKCLGNSIQTIYFTCASKGLNTSFIAELQGYINHIKPDVIYVPHLIERNIDHLLCNYILAKTLSNIGSKTAIMLYSVWSPLIPNLLVNITDVFTDKNTALNCYISQLCDYKFDNLIDHAAKYYIDLYHPIETWRICLEEKRLFVKTSIPWTHVEPFFSISCEEYISQANTLFR